MPSRSSFRGPATAFALALITAAAATSCGIRSGPSATSDRDASTIKQGAGSPGAPADSPRSVYESAAVDLQSLFEKLGSAPAPATAESTPGTPPKTSPPPVSTPPDPAPAVALEGPAKPAPLSEQAKREKRLKYARELAQLLIPDGGDTTSPLRAVLPLIALETIQPGVATAELNRLLGTLNESERKAVDTIRSLMAQIEGQADVGANPSALAAAVRSEVDRVAPEPPPEPVLSLGTVALCRKVEAFGRFTSYDGSSFVAGRRIPMIVYAEVENYVQAREADLPSAGLSRKSSGESWALELSQEIQLYAADGTLCWFIKEQAHRDASQSKRRDFFLVQRIDLPASLSIGRYTMKVIVRDKAAGAIRRDAEPAAEVNIVISIVADNAAASADTKRPIHAPPVSAASAE